MLSHLPTNAQDAQPVEEEDILEHEPHPASALPIPQLIHISHFLPLSIS